MESSGLSHSPGSSKYYSHTSPDCSLPPSGTAIAFSFRHVPKKEISVAEDSLPDFAAMGSKAVLLSPSFSGHPDWLSASGGRLVDYLRHLVVKKCLLMDRTSKDFPDLPDNKEGYYFLEIANDERHHEILIPAPYLRDETLRREYGLEAFEEVWKVIQKLMSRVMTGDQRQTCELIQKANEKLESEYPDTKAQFQTCHLVFEKLVADGNPSYALTADEYKDPKTKLIYGATAKRVDGRLSLEVTREVVSVPNEAGNPTGRIAE